MDPKFKQDLLSVFREPEYKEIHAELNRDLIKALVQRLHLVESKCNALEAQTKDLLAKVSTHEEEIEKLKSKSTLQEKVNRRNNLKIAGLKEPDDDDEEEDCKSQVINFIKDALSLVVKAEDIESAVRVGVKRLPKQNDQNKNNVSPNQKNSRPIFVKFNNYWAKREVYRERKQLKNYKDRVFLNEDLTPENAALYFECRQFVKKKSLHSAWTWEGQVYVKRALNQRNGYLVKNKDNLHDFLKTNKSNNPDSDSSVESFDSVQNESLDIRERTELNSGFSEL